MKRALKRNQQKLYYALYSDSMPTYEVDENGDIIYINIGGNLVPVETGDTKIGYSLPVEFKANISPAKGSAESEVFGINLDYTKSISTADTRLPITEASLIWHETEPVIGVDGTVDKDSADYSVVQVAKSLNSVMYAVKKLAKSG